MDQRRWIDLFLYINPETDKNILRGKSVAIDLRTLINNM